MTGEANLDAIKARLQGISAPEWEATPNGHGDPFVSEKGRGTFGRVASLSSHPADYGRGNMVFIANAPTDMRTLMEIIAQQEKMIADLTDTKKEKN